MRGNSRLGLAGPMLSGTGHAPDDSQSPARHCVRAPDHALMGRSCRVGRPLVYRAPSGPHASTIGRCPDHRLIGASANRGAQLALVSFLLPWASTIPLPKHQS
jgi:hypothetical protein